MFSNPETMRNIQFLSTLILCTCGLILSSSIAYSQSDNQTSSLEVVVDESSNAYFSVTFEKGSTLYSICKKYHVATIDAMMLNEIVNPEQISIGQKLILPLNKEFFRVTNKYSEGYIPVYYKTKKSETLFRISKVYFSQDVKDMIERNGLSGFTLSIDQKLLVGYYNLDGQTSPVKQEEMVLVQREVTKATREEILVEKPAIKEEESNKPRKIITPTPAEEKVQEAVAQKVEPTPSSSTEGQEVVQSPEPVVSVPLVAKFRFKPNKKARFRKIINSDQLDYSYSTEADTLTKETIVEPVKKPESNLVSKSLKGIGYWDKKGKDYENLMVLHKSAEVNTLIKLTNPINGLSTFARVVGRIPDNAFKKDIDVVMSPAVAKKIGAIDSRIQISMTYQINNP